MKFATMKIFSLFCGLYFLALPIVSLASECDRFICSQKCEILDGKPFCSCMQGFLLTGVNDTCAPKDPDWKILFTNGSEVAVISNSENKSGSVKLNLDTGLNSFASDVRKDVVYWTDVTVRQEAVYKKSFNNIGNPEVVVNVGINGPSWIAFDWITGNLYFVDGTSRFIAVCSQNPTSCTVVVQEDKDAPNGLALHPNQGIMFWTKSFWFKEFIPLGGSVIRKAGMDGSTPTTIISTGTIMPGSITVDETGSRIYWVPIFGDKIESSRFDGSIRRVIILSDLPIGIDILGDRIFWGTLTTDKIMSSDKLTGGNDITIMTNCSAQELFLQHITKQPKLRSNPCEDMKCSHICVLSGPSAQCLCPAGMISNGNVCVDDEEKPKLLVTQGNMLFAMRANTIGKDVFERIPLPSQIQEINDLVYNAINKTLIISDSKSRNIVEYDIKTEELKVLVENVCLISMDIDLVGENIFWIDGEKQTIEVLSLRTQAQAVVRRNVKNAHDILFVPDRGTLYLSTTAVKTGDQQIHKISLDKESNDTLFDECTCCTNPVKLAYNLETGGLIAAFSKGSGVTIRNDAADYEQFNKLWFFAAGNDSALDIAKIENQIFWVDQKNEVTVVSPRGTGIFSFIPHYHTIPTDFDTNLNNSSEFKKVLATIHPDIEGRIDKIREQHDCSPKNPKKKPCTHICLATGINMTGVCLCPVGFHLEDNGLTCLEGKLEHNEDVKTTTTTLSEDRIVLSVTETIVNPTTEVSVVKDTNTADASDPDSDFALKAIFWGVILFLILYYCCRRPVMSPPASKPRSIPISV